MTNDELIEAAAKAFHGGYSNRQWSWLSEKERERAIADAKRAYEIFSPLIRADEREQCAKVADEQDVYWNAVAYDRRQCGRDDNFACASASMANKIAAAIRERKIDT